MTNLLPHEMDMTRTTHPDRILHQGSLDLTAYSRAELKNSDHRPVFALFRTVVWIVDRVKQDALARLLLENVTSTSNGEKLDDKLAALTLHPPTSDCVWFNSVSRSHDLMNHPVPPPSSEDSAWWDRPGTYDKQLIIPSITDILQNSQTAGSPDHPNGVFVVTEAEEARYRSTNPFDSPTDSPLSSSPSLSDEELYAALQDPLTPAQVVVPVIVEKPPPLPSRARKPL